MSPFRGGGLKIVSLALAATLWFIVSGGQIVERALRVPLEFTNLPEKLEMVGDPPNVVDVRVRGSAGALARIAAGELVAVLDLHSAREGQRLFHLANVDVRAPFGVQVVQVTPSNMPIRFEPSETKTVPIVPAVEGDPAEGYVVGTVTAEPPTVQVVGPSSALRGLTEAITEPVSVTGAHQTVLDTVTVGSPDPRVRLQAPQMAQVMVQITAAPAAWTVERVQVQIRNATRPVEVQPRYVTLYVRGPIAARGGVRSRDFDASIDVSGLRAGAFELPVRIVPPPGIGVTRIDPTLVRVEIR